MIESLYPPFRKWSEKGAIYLISDPHFDDEDMKIFVPDKPSSEEIVKSINSKVGKNDTIIFLGDIGNIEWIKKVKGYKVLITGNHDSGNNNYQRKTWIVEKYISHQLIWNNESDPEAFKQAKIEAFNATKDAKSINYYYNELKHSWFWKIYCDNKLFDEVYNGPLFISDKILLSHEPINFENAINLHGHVHDKKILNDKNHINMVSERINYIPQSINSLIKTGILSGINSIHRDTIDSATARKMKKLEKKP